MNNQLTMTTEYHMTQIENTPSYQSLMNTLMAATPYLPEADVTVDVFELTEDDRNEVLAFLAERPIHTVCMTGFIRDNGLVSPHNRGTFYGCRNSENRLEGVALVGHATLIEARSLRAMREFGLVAQTHTRTHMIMGEVSAVEDFWNHYADEGQEMRRACRELLFELRHSAKNPRKCGALIWLIWIKSCRCKRRWLNLKAVLTRGKLTPKAFAPDAPVE